MVSPAEQEPPARALLPRPPHRRAKPQAARIVVVAQVSAARNPGRTMRKYTAAHARRCARTSLLCHPRGSCDPQRRRSPLRTSGPRPTSPFPYIPWPPVVSLSLPLALLPFSPNSRRPLSVSTSRTLSLSGAAPPSRGRAWAAALPSLRPPVSGPPCASPPAAPPASSHRPVCSAFVKGRGPRE